MLSPTPTQNFHRLDCLDCHMPLTPTKKTTHSPDDVWDDTTHIKISLQGFRAQGQIF
jgi:hypothetical protein